MNTKNAITTTTLSIIAVLTITSMAGINNAFAESNTDYKMADDVEAIFTFTFRDGIEVHKFPVFNMGENFVTNKGVSFEVEGIVTSAPLLHKAVDEAYKNGLRTSTGGASFDNDFRYFDVDVDFVKGNHTIRTLNYYNCEVQEYAVNTLRDDQESYLSSKTGFAIVDQIEFNCGGISSSTSSESYSRISPSNNIVEYPSLDYEFVNDVRTFITFRFDSGIEKIEFPFFELTSGFEEDDDSVAAEFKVESVIGNYPLLYKAIDKSRQVSGITSAFNTDFESLVEFTKNGETLRAFDFRDCRVDASEIATQQDKEDGFTGKSGFAIVHEIEFECAGLSPINGNYEKLRGDAPIWKTAHVSNQQPLHEFPTVNDVHAIATFTYVNGQEKIDFPLFDQDNVLVKSNPTFELKGIVGDFPLLYHAIDENLKLQNISGANPILNLFEVDIDLMVGNEIVRGFNYKDCRVVNYVVETERDKEDGYFKGFALENTFEFMCQGYHPNNPVYDVMFNTYEKADTINTNDLRDTSNWGPGFY